MEPAAAIPDIEAAKAAAAKAALMPPGNDHSVYGYVPASLLGPMVEYTRELVRSHAELECAGNTLDNAFGLYLKTRPPASTQSARRAKMLAAEGMSPLLLARMPKTKYTDVQVGEGRRKGSGGGQDQVHGCAGG